MPKRSSAEQYRRQSLPFLPTSTIRSAKANENFLELQRELSDTENKLQAARRFYNSVVQDLNAGIRMFPASYVATWGNFTAKEFFQLGDADAAAKEPVKISF
jgi:LemA protein